MYLLLPCEVVNNVFLYCLAYAAKRHGMRIHSIAQEGNHYHLVLTDTYGILPFFMADLNRTIAKALNCHYGRWESFWAPGSYDRKVCVTTEDSLDRMVYTMSNPTSSGLVEKVALWPGMVTLPEHFDGRVFRAKRPDFFFDAEGKMPEEVVLVIEPPPGCEDWDRAELIAYLRERIEQRESEAYEKYDGKFVGVKRILAMSPFDRPKTREPRRNVRYGIAANSKWTRTEAVHRLKHWERDHAESRERWVAGEPGVIFPAGTWWMKHFSPAQVERAPPPSIFN